MGISECINKCSKEEDNSQTPGNPYFIEETDSIVPQSIIDIKVNSGNFVIQRENAKAYDIYEKLQFLGEGSFGSVYKVKRKKSGTSLCVNIPLHPKPPPFLNPHHAKNPMHGLLWRRFCWLWLRRQACSASGCLIFSAGWKGCWAGCKLMFPT